MPTSHEEQRENVAAYLLGALTESESRELEGHLSTCAECREELERLRVGADALPRAVTPVSLPKELKPSLMEAVHQRASEDAQARRRRLRLPALLRRWPAWSGSRALAGALAGNLIVMGIAAGWGAAVLSQGEEAQPIAARVDRGRMPAGGGSLVVREGGEGATLRVHGLPVPANGAVYQVWLQRGGAVVPSAVFTVRADGSGGAPILEDLDGVQGVLVTRERAGGAPAPTEAPILTVETL